MDSDRNPEEKDYYDLPILDKYREEREELEAAEAQFQEDIKAALALSLSSENTQDKMSLRPQPQDTGQNGQSTRGSRRNRRFVSDPDNETEADVTRGDNPSYHPSGRRRSLEMADDLRRQLESQEQLESQNQYHPSGRRRSIEMADDLRRQLESQEEMDSREDYHPSGRRRSIEIAREMQNQMQANFQNGRSDDSDLDQYHPSGRRRSLEIAREMQQKMVLDSENPDDRSHGDQYHPSGRRRSIELADQIRESMTSQDDAYEAEMTKEIRELISRGILSDSGNNSDSELFGDGQSQGLAQSQRRPQHHVIDFKNPFPFDKNGFPTNWDKTCIAPYASNVSFHVVELLPGEEEYSAIEGDFKIAKLEVRKIERLQNCHQLDKFKSEQEHLLKKYGTDFEVNERYLYHGSTADKASICEEGLDARLSMTGCFGRGIYFSDNPRKCEQYVSRYGEKYILVCRVMLGESKIYQEGERDPDLIREPMKENPTGAFKYYDSVRGKPNDYNEFVVYESRRAMIEYIVTFHREGEPEDDYGDQIGGAMAANIIETESVEDHMKRIMTVREDVRRSRAEDKGEEYVPPSPRQRRKDRDIYRRVLLMSCPSGSPGHDHAKSISEYLLKEQQEEDSLTTSLNGSESLTSSQNENNNNNNSAAIDFASSFTQNDEEDSIKLVMSHLVADFLQITATNNSQMATMYLEKASMNLDQAILLYYEEMS